MMQFFDRIVSETVQSGVEPLQLTFTGIHDCYTGATVAYLTDTDVFCSATGTISDCYIEKIDLTETGKDFSLRNLIKAMRCVKELTEKKKKADWISVHATTSFLTQNDLYSVVKAAVEKENFSQPEKICVELSDNVFSADRESVRKGIADLKVLGFKTLISGFAADGFPTSSLLDISFDVVVLAPEITALATDRNKPGVLDSLIRFARSMDVQVVGKDALDDDTIRELNKAECFGFIPASSYYGKFDPEKGKRPFDKVLEEQED